MGFFAVLTIRLFFLQVLNHGEYADFAESVALREKQISGMRGIIYDRNGIPLTRNITCHTLWINTIKDLTDTNMDQISGVLSQAFEKPAQFYRNLLKKRSRYVVLEKDVPSIQYLPLASQLKELHVNSDPHVRRHYPFGDLASQVIGYTNPENKGVIGIEKQFNDVLSGSSGMVKMEKRAGGKLLTSIYDGQTFAADGRDIILTLDIRYQAILQDELKLAMQKTNAESANGIIVDPFTGEILAMATVPAFDPNNYSAFPVETHLNKVISEPYEPGSTFKIVTISAGLENNAISSWKTYDCEGGKYRIFNRTFHDHEEYDVLTVSEILMHSSNIGMVKIAMDVGAPQVYKYSLLYGFGEPTGIMLPHEQSGILRDFDDWTQASGPTIAMGQEIAVTTLQTAMSYSAVSNGGYLLQPQIVREISGNSNSAPFRCSTKVIRRVVSEGTATAVMSMLREVITKGTADKARLPGFPLAGKTSTAQKFTDGAYSKTKYISAFAGIYPSYQPQLVCMVAVDSPKYGSHWGNETAAPIVRKIIERIINTDDRFNDSPENNMIFTEGTENGYSIQHLTLSAHNYLRKKD